MINELRGKVICRFCASQLDKTVLDLGIQPIANDLLRDALQKSELWPLEFKICMQCGLGQIGEFVTPDKIFDDYTYFSSASSSWLNHAENFAMSSIKKYGLNSQSLVLEVASNDGYLLQYFQRENIKILGIEPALTVAENAIKNGIPTITSFFGKNVAEELIQSNQIPSLVICNNVVAHVPDINDFVGGLSLLAQQGAIISVEAPSMIEMLKNNYFDTIYHEHFSYLTANVIKTIAQFHGMSLFEIEKLSTHGGSNRYWLTAIDTKKIDKSVEETINQEIEDGLFDSFLHEKFANNTARAILEFEEWILSERGTIVGFGAAAKATVLLNACKKIPAGKINMIADSALSKQGKLVPGVRIPIVSPEQIYKAQPNNIVIFAWNVADEIAKLIREKIGKNCKIWTPLPYLKEIK